jgi:hypothetical protein
METYCDLVMQARHSPCFKDHISCKDKGALMNGNFKFFLNYHVGIGIQWAVLEYVYSKMSKVRLPSQFGQGMHILMENFLAIGQSLILPTWRMAWMKQMQTTILFLQSMCKMTLFHYFMNLVSKETQLCIKSA